jgi:citrate synthase
MPSDRRYFTALEAAGALGISLPTLYAYTSRGQLRSEPVPGRPRERRYFRTEIEQMQERKASRHDPAQAAARGLHWGSPVLASSITLIEEGRLYYRGRDVVELAAKATLEEVAGLLWSAEAAERGRPFAPGRKAGRGEWAALRSWRKTDTLVQLQAALPLAGARDPASFDLRPAAVRQTGARILRLLTAVAAGRDSDAPIHAALQAAWAPKRGRTAEVIRAALVLSADHELNASAFTARCAASAGANPYDVVSAALATLKGHRHGGETERVAALMAEIGTPQRARAVLASRLRRGERLPGFGHPLYPNGDPRAALLIRLAEASGNPQQWALVKAACRASQQLVQELPNLDFGLVAVGRTCGLPREAPLLLFAIGRTAGWIAHALEQYASGELIRPRAKYVGPPPEPDEGIGPPATN